MAGISRDQIFAQGTRIYSMGELGPALRAARKRLGYTQQYVADFMGCSPRLIGEIERGRGTVAFDTVTAYAMNLAVDLVAFDRNKD